MICQTIHTGPKSDELSSKKQLMQRTKEFMVGAGAGVLEVGIDQPLVYLKNSWQLGQTPSRNLLAWYRGGFINAASMGPITAVQLAVAGGVKHFFPDRHSASAQLWANFVGGFSSGLISGPAEFVILHKQAIGKTSTSPKKFAWYSYTRGMLPACLRDGGFAACCFGLTPLIKARIQSKNKTAITELLTLMVAGGIAGIGAATVTHPADTIKTYMQHDMEGKTWKNMRATAMKLYTTEGLKGFYKGYTPRAFRVIVGTIVMSGFVEFFKAYKYI